MDSEDPDAEKPDVEMVNYDPDNLYRLLQKRQEDLLEAMGIMESGIKTLQSTKQGDKPITLEEQFHFVLRLFEDINVLYLSNMALIAQFKKGVWINGISDLPEKKD